MTELHSSARILVGKIISDKMESTAVILVERNIKHPKYGKFIKRTSKLNAHNDGGYKLGEVVKIMETKPYSKTKFWKIVERV